jgi:MarR family 2-MHQ and catechol resistance regulon transcriptional repressor
VRWAEEPLPEELDIMKRVSGLPVNVPAIAVVTNIWRAAQALKATAERTVLREYGLSWASFSTLYILWVWGPLETRALARSQGVSRPTVTSLVDTLERRGFVRRSPVEGDRRLVTVELTAEGRACIEQVYPIFNRTIEAGIVADLDRGEQEQLAGLLRAVIASTLSIDRTGGEAENEVIHDDTDKDRAS